MPQPGYMTPLMSTVGSLGGSALGGEAGSMLGKLFSPLDLPRQAATNFLDAFKQGDWQKLIPGLAGAATGLGGGLLAAPLTGGLSIPLSVLLGSIGGGATQAGLESTDPERFKAPTTEEFTGSQNPFLNWMVGAITDPLSYTGGAFGEMAGSKLGRMLGERWSGIGQGLGPGFTGGAASVAGPLEEAIKTGKTSSAIRNMSRLPEETLAQLGSEVAPGSKVIGGGESAVTLGTPTGGVTKIGLPSFTPEGAGAPVPDLPPDIPGILKPTRHVEYPGGFTVTHEPRLIPVEGMDPATRMAARRQMAEEIMPRVKSYSDVVTPRHLTAGPGGTPMHESSLEEMGLPFSRNIGIDPHTGEMQIFDRQGFTPIPGDPLQKPTPTQPGSWLERKLLGPGLQSDYRQYLAEQTARPQWGASDFNTQGTILQPGTEPYGPPSELGPGAYGKQTLTGGLAKEGKGGRHIGTLKEEAVSRPEAVNDLVQKTQDAMQRPPGGAGELLNTMEGMSQPELRRALEAMGVDVKAALKGTVGDEKWDALYQAFHDLVLEGRNRQLMSMGGGMGAWPKPRGSL